MENVVGRGLVDVIHDQDLSLTELRLDATLGVGRGFGVALSLPVRRYATSIQYVAWEDGAVVDIVNPGVHHRDESLVGLGDPWLLGVYGRRLGDDVHVSGRVGLSLPVGETEEDPFRLGDMGLPHQHFQMGSGTLQPLVGGDVRWRIGSGLAVDGFVLGKLSFYENGHGYRAGHRYAGGLAGEKELGRFALRLGADVQHEAAERWHGEVPEDDGNRGRTDVLVRAGGRVRAGAGTFSVGVAVPVYQHVVGGQIDLPFLVDVSAAWSFDLWGAAKADAHDHDHDHHDHHHAEPLPDAPELDVLTIENDGAAIDLEPVVGKITVFDFFATWCEPCHDLDAKLRDLAAKHPGRLAVRKINVVDFDSEAWKRYLAPGHFSLPHVKIYDAGGKLVNELSAAPDELASELEKWLSASSK